MKSLKYFFKKAKKEKWAIGQFNFSTLEQLKAIVSAAEKLKSPVILGTSQGEVNFFGIEEAILLRDLYRKKFPYIYLNLDHGKDVNLIKKAINLGYDCVHFDGSGLDFQENLKITKKIVKYAHKKGCLVEGEIKSIHGGSEIHKELPKKSAKKYMLQMQWNMYCTDTKLCYFISYDPRFTEDKHKIVILEIERDNNIIEEIKELMKYKPESAGGIMTKEFVALPGDITVEEVDHIHGVKVTNAMRTIIDIIREGTLSEDLIKQAINEATNQGMVVKKTLKKFSKNYKISNDLIDKMKI